jgi:uncharacterized membrane protein YgcG
LGFGVILAIVWAMLAVGGVLGASPSPSAPPPGPPYPEPVDDQAIYDFAGVLRPETVTQAEHIVDAIETQTGVEVVVYTQAMGRDDLTTEEAESDAAALMDEWGVGRAGIDDGLVILFELDTSLAHGQVQLYAGDGFESTYLSSDERQAIFENDMVPLLQAGDFDNAILVALGHVLKATFEPPVDPGTQPAPVEPSPGPPFPDPVIDRAVYDYAGILTPDAIVRAEAVIDGIEARTGAEVVVYTQLTDYGVDASETESRARALIDQWHIGRAGFNDGMVIFFDIDPSLEHGQVQLYAAPGFEAAFLSNAERQAIFENDMVPLLRNADFDGALEVALQKVDAVATPEHAASLEQARQLNAVLGLIGAPVVLLGLSGWAFFNWRRYGKDPVYLDDPSILMPAPPPDLTAASGAMVMDGGTSRRALTTAMLDLASRGLLSFREEKGLLGLNKKVGVDVDPVKGDETEEAQRARNARRPIGPAEEVALKKLQTLGVGESGYISPDELPKFGSSVDDFDRALEKHVVARGWFAEAPSKVSARWTGRGVLVIIAGVIALVAGWNVPISGLVLIGGGAIAGGIVILLFAQGMPAVTMPGAIIRAMLAAYRRTLEKTMAQARTMQQVVDEAGLDWLETPDQAVVWGTALGLQHEIEGVLDRSLEEARTAGASASPIWFPTWYRSSDGSSFASAGAVAGSGGGLFSDSGMPDLGGMMSALGTIGNSPSSSGGGGSGGGFSGGSSGGGGGGAGGGF